MFSHVHGIDNSDSRFNRKYRHLCRPYSPQPILGDIVICPEHLLNSRDCRFSSRKVAIYFTFFRYTWKWIKTLCHLCEQHRLESLERETVECGKVELPVSNTSVESHEQVLMNVSESRTITEASVTRKTLRKTDEKSTQLNSFSSAKLHNDCL